MNKLTAFELQDIINKKSLLARVIEIQEIECIEPFTLDLQENHSIQFNNCHFHHLFNIYSSYLDAHLLFKRCEFKSVIEVNGLNGKAGINFSKCKILNGFHINDANNFRLYMGESVGKGEFSFGGVTFDVCQFKRFKFLDEDDDNSISFLNCCFNINNFEDAFLVNCSFNGALFKQEAKFDYSKLHYNISPGAGNFGNVTFEKDAFFNATNFTKGAFFNRTQFLGSAIFFGCNTDSKDCIADFSAAKFYKRAFFDNSNFNDLTLKNVEFKEVASFKHINCQSIELSKCIFLQSADFLNATISKASRESFRMIKHELLRNNDLLESTVYQAKELQAHEEVITWKNEPQEKFALWLNKTSNDFGLSWWKAAKFTVGVTALFYVLYLISLGNPPAKFGWDGWKSFLTAIHYSAKYFMRFFIITHDLDFMKDYEPNAGSYLIDTIARIFIAYGIYQTVQAFRKYGKN